MTDSARTEEIRARVGEISNQNRYYALLKMDIQYLLTELTALREEVERLKGALEEILSRFPEQEVIDELMADEGYGYRPYRMEPTPRDSDIVRWRAALSPSPAQQEAVPKQD